MTFSIVMTRKACTTLLWSTASSYKYRTPTKFAEETDRHERAADLREVTNGERKGSSPDERTSLSVCKRGRERHPTALVA